LSGIAAFHIPLTKPPVIAFIPARVELGATGYQHVVHTCPEAHGLAYFERLIV